MYDGYNSVTRKEERNMASVSKVTGFGIGWDGASGISGSFCLFYLVLCSPRPPLLRIPCLQTSFILFCKFRECFFFHLEACLHGVGAGGLR